jgi:hypothetical protein
LKDKSQIYFWFIDARFTQIRKALHSPLLQVAISCGLTIVFTLIATRLKNFNGAGQFILLAYHAPIAFAFSIFILSEFMLSVDEHWARHILSLIVIVCSLTRAVVDIPFFSGHAFFITYMVLVAKSKTARTTAILVFLDVIWIKLFVLHDPTIWGGIALGLVAWGCLKLLKIFTG